MSSARTSLFVFLAATTLGGALLAWRQYGELVELRALGVKKDERADLQKRLWDLEKRNRDLQGQLLASRSGAADPATEGKPNDRGPGRQEKDLAANGSAPRDRGMQQLVAMRELLGKPEVQAMVNLQQKSAVEQRYAPFFKNLNLPTEQIDKLKALLAERATTVQDVLSVATEQGMNPRENPAAFRKLIATAQNEITSSMRAVIGDAGLAQLSSYEQSIPQRTIVNDLQMRLSYTSTPLTPAQADQLVGILAANPPARKKDTPTGQPNAVGPAQGVGVMRDGARTADLTMSLGAGGSAPPEMSAWIMSALIGGLGLPGGGNDAPARGAAASLITPAALSQAQGVLAPPQAAALQQIQQQQQSQQELRQLINETLAPKPNSNPTSPPFGINPPPATPAPPAKRPAGGP